MASERPTFVAFRGVRKSYDGRVLVVKDLDLAILKGEFLTLLGPSGSGKTTCLMMLAGFERPTSGTITVDGEAITDIPPYRRGIGMVFQNYALFPHLTVAENVAFPLQVRGLGRADIEARVARALAMVQLPQLGGRLPAQLSGGQQQRVALARALVFEPRLVLMDEPLGALDRQLRETMQYEIRHLHERLGVTVVYVTHDQAEALTMSDRVAVFEAGVVRQLATPQELYEAPANAFVARFVGENNRLAGRVLEREGAFCTVEVAGHRIRAAEVASEGPGGGTTLSLRPERVVLGAEPGSVENVFEGVVREVTYLGDHWRARLAVCGSESFVAKVPNAAGRPAIIPGEPVRVGWRAADCRALDPTPQAA